MRNVLSDETVKGKVLALTVLVLLSLSAYFYFPVSTAKINYGSLEWAIQKYRICLLEIICARMVMTLSPQRWATWIQTAALLIAFTTFRFDVNYPKSSGIMLGTPLLLFFVLQVFRRSGRIWQLESVIAGTLMIPLLVFFYFIPRAAPFYVVFSTVGSIFSFLMTSVSLSDYSGAKPWGAALRAMSTHAAGRGPVALEYCTKVDRSLKGALRGLLWLIFALAMIFVLRLPAFRELALHFKPIEELKEGHIFLSFVFALGIWVEVFLHLGAPLLLDGCLLRLIGVGVPVPIDSPWRSVNFADYWRRANVFRYEMCRRVYLPYFAKMPGHWIYAGIVFIFLISAPAHYFSKEQSFTHIFIRWFLEGAATAVTIWWIRKRRRKLKSRSLAGLIAAILAVLIAHGFLFDIVGQSLFLHYMGL